MKASIIVPVYNAEKTIGRCIESLCSQSEKDIEILLIDDGSADNSHAVCLNKAKNDTRIRVIKKANGGVSSARNAGIDAAEGEYLLFCDSDDMVDPEWCETLLSLSSPECVGVCGYYSDTEGDKIPYGFEEDKTISSADFLDIGYGVLLGSVCNKCFYTKNIKDNDLKFDETTSFEEDVIFTVKYFSFCKTIKLTEKILYNYFNTAGSLIHSTQSIKPQFIIDVYNLIENTIKALGGNFAKYEETHYRAVFSSLEPRIVDRDSAKEILNNKQFRKSIAFADKSRYDQKYLLLLKAKAIPVILKLKS